MTTTNRTPISKLKTAEIIALTLAGHLVLKDGKAAYSDKADRAAAREATKARRQDVLDQVTAFFGTVRGQSTKFYSIKPTGGSFAAKALAINQFVEASREDILWSLKQLEKEGLARQVGIKSETNEDGDKYPVVVDPTAVNNFQRRWIHSVEPARAQDEDAQDEDTPAAE
jgi:hypothetical protein